MLLLTGDARACLQPDVRFAAGGDWAEPPGPAGARQPGVHAAGPPQQAAKRSWRSGPS